MEPAGQGRFEELRSWAGSHGAELNSAVEIYEDEITNASLRVKKDNQPAFQRLGPGDSVVTCPMSISLSYINALVDGPLTHPPLMPEPKPAFPAVFMQQIPPHVIGRFFLVKEYLKKADSYWWPYIQSLPQPESLGSWSLPAFWPEEDASILEGTNAGVAIGEMQGHLKQEFKEARRILKDANFENWQDYSRLLYNWAFCIFTSRSFRPSLVFSDEAQKTAQLLISDRCGLDDFSTLLPIFDLANHSVRARIQWDTASRPEACRLVCHDVYEPGAQVYNNYGKKTNGELLLAYGFLIPETDALHNDYFHLRKREDVIITDVSSGDSKPRDLLISLRPINDLSSLVGRARQRVASHPDFKIKPEFSHVEDSLIWDLCRVGMSDAEQAQFIELVVPKGVPLGMSSSTLPEVSDTATVLKEQREHECLRRVLSGALPPDAESIESKVKEILLAKLGYEYDKLCESDPVVEGDGEELMEVEPSNKNQLLALTYRMQCKKVLENAISTLVPDWDAEGAEDNS